MSNSDPLMLNCGTHGERVSALVRKHMLRNEPTPAGFIENSSDPDDLQAWCYQCEEKFEQEGGMTDAFKALNAMALLGIDCYKDAKVRHALSSNQSSATVRFGRLRPVVTVGEFSDQQPVMLH